MLKGILVAGGDSKPTYFMNIKTRQWEEFGDLKEQRGGAMEMFAFQVLFAELLI